MKGRQKAGAIEQARVINRGHRSKLAEKVVDGADQAGHLQGGAKSPIVVLNENDVIGRGGQYRLAGGPAIPMIAQPEGRILGGKSRAVYPVDANGDYDYGFPRSDYMAKVLSVQRDSLIGYWVQDEETGLISRDSSPQKNDGVYTAVTLGAEGIGDGLTSASYNGATSVDNIYSLALNADFNGAEGTLIVWPQVANPGVWTDGLARRILNTSADAENRLLIYKETTDHIIFLYEAGNIVETEDIAITPLDFFSLGMTWSATADAVNYYLDGVPIGSDAGLGVWVGNLAATTAVIGAFNITPIQVWNGNIAHVQHRNVALSPAEMLYLGVL